MSPDQEPIGLVHPRIVLVTGSLRGGGAERVLSDMANYWAAKGWDVTFATWSGPDVEDFYDLNAGVERVWLDGGHSASFFFSKARPVVRRIAKLRKLLTGSTPDAVLSFISTSNVMTILAAFRLQTNLVVSERIDPSADRTISASWRLARRITYSWSDDVIVQSRQAEKWIKRNCRIKPIVIQNPLRTLPLVECEREPLIVAIGRLADQKGFDLLLRAFAKVAADFSDWGLTIIGEGRERDKLCRLRDELSLTQRVQMVGQVRDVESWMARAGLVVQPSRFEGFPNVLLESMGMGAPVISTDCPSGPADLIEDGVNGRLVPVDDVPALARVMTELMAAPEVRESLGSEASKVRSRFRQDEIMQRWEECLVPEYARGPSATCGDEGEVE